MFLLLVIKITNGTKGLIKSKVDPSWIEGLGTCPSFATLQLFFIVGEAEHLSKWLYITSKK